jgi:hypothetical protein
MKICVKHLVSDPGSEREGRRETVSPKDDQVTRQMVGWVWEGHSERGWRDGQRKTDRRRDDRMAGRKPQIFLLRSVQGGEV